MSSRTIRAVLPSEAVSNEISFRFVRGEDPFDPSGDKKSYKNDAARVSFLFALYPTYTSLLLMASAKTKRKGKFT